MPSSPVAWRRWLTDIRDNVLLGREFIHDMTFEGFCDNNLAFYAVTRCLEIISEASRRLPPDLKARHPTIPWSEMAGAGNVFRHDYEDVQHRLVWGTVQTRFGALLEAVEAELKALDDLDD